MPLFRELTTVHQEIFASAFERLQWRMVASFECSLARRGSQITVEETTFWLSPARDPESSCTLVFCDPKEKELGERVTSDAITMATGLDGDIKFVLGFANDEYVAHQAFDQHMRNDTTETSGSYTHNLSPRPTNRSGGSRRRGGRCRR